MCLNLQHETFRHIYSYTCRILSLYFRPAGFSYVFVCVCVCVCVFVSVCVERDCFHSVVVSVKDDNKHGSTLPDVTQWAYTKPSLPPSQLAVCLCSAFVSSGLIL